MSLAIEAVGARAVQNIPADAVWLDPAMQWRQGDLDDDHIASIVAAIEAGENVPPIIVAKRVCPDVEPGPLKCFLTVSGHHTTQAFLDAGRASIPAIVLDDADDDELAEVAWRSNRSHGLAYSAADRRRRVVWLLRHRSEMSQRAIAADAGVSQSTVKDIVDELRGKKRAHIATAATREQRIGKPDFAISDEQNDVVNAVRKSIDALFSMKEPGVVADALFCAYDDEKFDAISDYLAERADYLGDILNAMESHRQ